MYIGSGTGDPHFTTLDGKYYHFQGEGDFVTLELLPFRPNNPPELILQGRHKVLPMWEGASWHVAIAFGRPDLAFQVSVIHLSKLLVLNGHTLIFS